MPYEKRDLPQSVAAKAVVVARLLTAVAAILLVIVGLSAVAGAQEPQALNIGDDVHAGRMDVPISQSRILRVDRPFTDLLVADPEIVDVMALTDRTIYVLGKAFGTTTLTVYGENRRLLAVLDLEVGQDVAALRQRLNEMLPDEPIEVRSGNGAVLLSGTVSTASAAERAMAIARQTVPGEVTNLLSISGTQQVMVSVRIAEVTRSLVRELGIKPSLVIDDDVWLRPIDPIDLARFALLTFNAEIGDVTIDGLIDALEEEGVVKVLAEPNLVALSGDTATFLAGGEFPIPVSQEVGDNGYGAITVEFKKFGVSLAFTPTVLDNDVINLRVSPEVSQIDPSTSVTVGGISVPGLSTRRATTTIELHDGQSFAIAGLIQNNFQDQVRQIPGLAEIPVLGALMRSSAYERRETELVIIVTPHLVQPAPPEALAAPTDSFVPPHFAAMVLAGQVEGQDGPRRPAEALAAQPGGGMTGRYGHIIE